MTEYSEPSPTAQNATGQESHEGQTSAVSGTESEPATPSEGAAAPPAFNADSPEARHFQSVSDRTIAKARAESESALAAVRNELAAARAQLSTRAPAESQPEQSSQSQTGLPIDWSKAPRFIAPEGGYFDEATVEALNRAQDEKIRWTIEQIQNANAQQQAQAQAQQAEQVLVGFAQGLETPKQAELVGLVRQYEGIARQNPEAFIAFAKVQLGLNGQAAEAPQQLANKEQVIPSTRPTQNRAALAPKFAPGTSLEDKVRANVRRAMGG
jgi:hypothetical protein